jgi:hypothetical protein
VRGRCWKHWRHLENRASRRDFHCGNTPCIQSDKSTAVLAAQHAGRLRQRGNDVVHSLVFAARVAMLVRDVYAFTTNEPDSKHDSFHAPQISRAYRPPAMSLLSAGRPSSVS